jgi:hypothetical protein
VGGVWRYALTAEPTAARRARHSAVLSTALALLAVCLWVFTWLRIPR